MAALVVLTKFLSVVLRWLRLGGGGTWPGEIILRVYPDALSTCLRSFSKGIILVAGTNGKTTTVKMITQVIRHAYPNQTIVTNDTGANLTNGIVSSCIRSSNWIGQRRFDWGVFECDENVLPIVISELKTQNSNHSKKIILVLLNLFRDQLDRYGEVDTIARKWKGAMHMLPSYASIVANADDPQIAFIASTISQRVLTYGLDLPDQYLKTEEHATDSTYCPRCSKPLTYRGIYYSHLGVWSCDSCGLTRPKLDIQNPESPLSGLYNRYNTASVLGVANVLGIAVQQARSSLSSVSPAFGRQEEFIHQGKKVKLWLAKNPAGFNAALRTVLEFKPKVMMIVLNDRIPDGRDVSWIWDVDFEMIPEHVRIVVSGDRAWDMGLRIKYSEKTKNSNVKTQNIKLKFQIFENVLEALKQAGQLCSQPETLFILATYSGMLETRKILAGKKLI